MSMIKEIRKQVATPQFKVGDRVIFYYESPQRGGHSVYNRPVYCIVKKLNKVTAIVVTQDKQYKVSLEELKPYVDPTRWG